MSSMQIRLRRYPKIGPYRHIALREFLLDEIGILKRGYDYDVFAVLPVARCSHAVAIGELQRIDDPQDLGEIAARTGGISDDQSDE